HSHGHGHGGPWRGDPGPMARFAARFRLLEALATASVPLSVSEIAERIGVDQPRASRLVQATVAAGHARREADENDARRTNILLTEEGRALVAQARGARVSAVETALADFSPEEKAQLAALLGRLAQAWPREP
ncbi:MAG TPA: MarR family transcriptional regulator, partial [Microbacterium sp.]|nr:MarR family transcriptional regulator [Microbacterium sp.]